MQPIIRSVIQPARQSLNPLASLLARQTISMSVSLPVIQSVHQSVSQPASQCIFLSVPLTNICTICKFTVKQTFPLETEWQVSLLVNSQSHSVTHIYLYSSAVTVYMYSVSLCTAAQGLWQSGCVQRIVTCLVRLSNVSHHFNHPLR